MEYVKNEIKLSARIKQQRMLVVVEFRRKNLNLNSILIRRHSSTSGQVQKKQQKKQYKEREKVKRKQKPLIRKKQMPFLSHKKEKGRVFFAPIMHFWFAISKLINFQQKKKLRLVN